MKILACWFRAVDRALRLRRAKQLRRFRLEVLTLEERLVPAGRTFELPAGGSIAPVAANAAYANEAGLYRVDGGDGAVGGILPGEAGYATAAVAARVVVQPSGAWGGPPVDVAPGQYGAYLIQNSSAAEWVTDNPNNDCGRPAAFFSFVAANPDGFDHFRLLEGGRFAFEDLTGGGDKDFDDFVGHVRGFEGNAPPSISSITDQIIRIGESSEPVLFTVADDTTPVAELSVSVASSNQTLLPPGAIILGGSGASRTISITSGATGTGQATVTVTVTDAAGSATSTVFEVQVVLSPVPVGRTLVVPTCATVAPLAAIAAYANEVGLYPVDGEDGAVGGIHPGDAGYAAAAVAARVVVQPSGVWGGPPVAVAAGLYGAYLIQDASAAEWAVANPNNDAGRPAAFFSFPAANPDGFDHFRLLGDGRFAFEDLTGGGDQDFDDFIGAVRGTADNAPPSLTPVADQVTTADVALGLIPFTVADAETPAGDLLVSVSSSNIVLVPNGGVIVGGAGAARTLTITPATGQIGTATLTLTVTDGCGLSSSDTFQVTVEEQSSPLNRNPVFTSSPNLQAREGEPYVYDAMATDPDGDTLTYSLAGAFPQGMTIHATMGVISWTPSTQQVGDAAVIVRVEDGKGGSAMQPFTVTVAALLNRAPVITSEPITSLVIESDEQTQKGSVFITGHDPIWHSHFNENDTGAKKIARTMIDYVRNGSPLPFLFVESTNVPVPSFNTFEAPFLTADLGYATSEYVVADASVLNGFTDFRAALANYSAVVVASDHGGMLTAAELSFLNAHASDLIDYINSGGGLAASAESNFNALIGDTPRFQFLPFVISSTDFHAAEVGNTVSEFGSSLGLSNSDINGNVSHSFFSSTGGLTPVDLFGGDPTKPLSLAFRGQLDTDGVIGLYRYDVEATDPDGDTLEYALTTAPAGMTINSDTGRITWAPSTDLVDQSFPVTVRVEDGKGGFDEQSFSVNVSGNHAPVITSEPVTTATSVILEKKTVVEYAGEFRYSVVAFDEVAGFQSVDFDDSEFLTGMGGFGTRGFYDENTGTPLGTDWGGNSDILLRRSINLPAGTSNFQVRVAIDNDIQVFLNGQDISGGMVTSEGRAEYNRFTFVAPDELLNVGENILAVRARDRGVICFVDVAVSAEVSKDWTPNEPIDSTGYFYDVDATDVDSDTLTFSLSAAPPGMSIDSATGRITWAPKPEFEGQSFPVTVLVEDGKGGFDEQSFTIVVATTLNHNPVFTSSPNLQARAGEPYVYAAVAIDPDGDTLQYGLTTAPAGMTINSNTGEINWQVSASQNLLRNPSFESVPSPAVLDQGVLPLDWFNAGTTTPGADTFSESGDYGVTPDTYGHWQGVEASEGSRWVAGGKWPFSELIEPFGQQLSEPLITGASYRISAQLLQDTGTGSIAAGGYRILLASGPSTSTTTFEVARLSSTTGQASWEFRSADFVVPSELSFAAEFIIFEPVAEPEAFAYIGLDDVRLERMFVDGAYPVAVRVEDGKGGFDEQHFTITLTSQPNRPPAITSVPKISAVPGLPYEYQVTASDPDGDPLLYRLIAPPDGISIDAGGLVTWAAPTLGNFPITIEVDDGRGGIATQSFTLTVAADTTAPTVQLNLSAVRVPVGTSLVATVNATDNVGVVSRSLSFNGQDVTLDANSRATLPAVGVGVYTLVATATDANGNVGQTQATLKVFDPAVTLGPLVEITRFDLLKPNNQVESVDPRTTNATVTYLTDVVGSITPQGNPIDNWRLMYARADQVDPANLDENSLIWKTIAVGNGEVTNAKLGTFDPTMLENDRYTIAVVAFDIAGQGFIRSVDADVTGNAKLGEFRLEYTDLSIPLVGINIDVKRIYDTRTASESKDFGFGWQLGLRDARIRETVQQGGDGFFTTGAAFKDGTKVYLTNADGVREGFTFFTEPRGSLLGPVFSPKFRADPGVTDTLEVDQISLRSGPNGYTVFPLSFDYNPDTFRLTTKEGLTYHYDQFGGLQRIADRNTNEVTFDDAGIHHSSGQSITFDRDGSGRIAAVRTPDGNVAIRYTYNTAGDLVSVEQVTKTATATTDEESLNSKYTYRSDRAHYIDEIFDANGKRAAKTEYDSSGRLISITDALGNKSEQIFDPTNFSETVKDKRGNPTMITYNERGNLVHTEQPTESGSIITLFEYGDSLNPDKETKITNPRGFVTTRAYDNHGNLLSETTPDGVTAFTYNELNKLTSVTDSLLRKTTYDYDAAGNLKRVTNALNDFVTFDYDANGRVMAFTDFKGNTTLLQGFSPAGQPQTIINPDQSIRNIAYNRFGQVTKVTDEVGNITENFYDAVGRLVRVKDGEVNETHYGYDANNNQNKITDALGNETEYRYDDNHQRTRIIDAEGGETIFTYDANGNLETVTDPETNFTTFKYDKANRLIEEIDPLGKSRFYSYDVAGYRIQAIDRNGRKRTFEYDAMNRQTHEYWWDGSIIIRDIVSIYDTVGNLLSASDPDSKLSYTYDKLNRVRTATTEYFGTNVPVFTLTYDYDKNGNQASVVDQTGVRVNSEYNNRNELIVRTWQGGEVDDVRVEFDYYANGERKKLERFSDLAGTQLVGTTEYTYYGNGLSKTIVHSDAAGNLIAGYSYIYDDVGRLAEETRASAHQTFFSVRTSVRKSVL